MSKTIEQQVEEFAKETMLFKVGEGDIEKMSRLNNFFVEALQERDRIAREEAYDQGVMEATDVCNGLLKKAREEEAIKVREEEAIEYNKIIEREVKKAREEERERMIMKLFLMQNRTLPTAMTTNEMREALTTPLEDKE